MTAAEVIDAIAREWARLVKAFDALGAGASTVPVTDEGWTAKDVLAHLIHWARQIAFGLGTHVQPPVYMMEERKRRELSGMDTSAMPTGEESNALAVTYYREVPMGEVRTELERLMEAIVERVRLRTDEQMSATDAIRLPGAGRSGNRSAATRSCTGRYTLRLSNAPRRDPLTSLAERPAGPALRPTGRSVRPGSRTPSCR